MPLVLKQLMRMESPNSFLTLYSNTLAYMIPSSLTEAHNLPLPSLVNLPASLNMMSASPPPTTPKLMGKLNEPIRRLKLIFGSSAPIILRNRLNFSPQLNLSITPSPTVQPKPLSFPFSLDMNRGPTHHSERLSSQL